MAVAPAAAPSRSGTERLFEDTPTQRLRLVSTKTFRTGVLHLVYAPEAD